MKGSDSDPLKAMFPPFTELDTCNALEVAQILAPFFPERSLTELAHCACDLMCESGSCPFAEHLEK